MAVGLARDVFIGGVHGVGVCLWHGFCPGSHQFYGGIVAVLFLRQYFDYNEFREG